MTCAALFSQPGFCAEEFKYAVSTTTTYGANYVNPKKIHKAGASETSREDYKVVLAPTWFAVTKKDKTTIYDFARKKMISVDDSTRTYGVTDLHAMGYFRVMESQNRKMLGSALAKASVKDMFPAFATECSLGIVLPDSPKRQIQETKTSQSEKFNFDGKEVASVTYSNYTPESQNENSYRRFLVYCTNLHPQILQSVLSVKKLPSEIAYETNGVKSPGGEDKVDMRLLGKPIPTTDKMPLPQGYTEKYSELIAPIVKALDKLGKSPQIPDSAQLSEFVNAAKSRGNCLDGFLAVNEQGWMAPLAPTVIEDAKSLRLGLTTEPQARIFVENSNPQNKEQLARAVENLEKIDRTKLQKSEALDVLIANDLQGLGRQKEAQECMAAALTKNPLLVSAYIDLFGMLCTAWNPTDAWQSYDSAKQINPDYERVKQIQGLELKLEKDYPTLF